MSNKSKYSKKQRLKIYKKALKKLKKNIEKQDLSGINLCHLLKGKEPNIAEDYPEIWLHVPKWDADNDKISYKNPPDSTWFWWDEEDVHPREQTLRVSVRTLKKKLKKKKKKKKKKKRNKMSV